MDAASVVRGAKEAGVSVNEYLYKVALGSSVSPTQIRKLCYEVNHKQAEVRRSKQRGIGSFDLADPDIIIQRLGTEKKTASGGTDFEEIAAKYRYYRHDKVAVDANIVGAHAEALSNALLFSLESLDRQLMEKGAEDRSALVASANLLLQALESADITRSAMESYVKSAEGGYTPLLKIAEKLRIGGQVPEEISKNNTLVLQIGRFKSRAHAYDVDEERRTGTRSSIYQLITSIRNRDAKHKWTKEELQDLLTSTKYAEALANRLPIEGANVEDKNQQVLQWLSQLLKPYFAPINTVREGMVTQ